MLHRRSSNEIPFRESLTCIRYHYNACSADGRVAKQKEGRGSAPWILLLQLLGFAATRRQLA